MNYKEIANDCVDFLFVPSFHLLDVVKVNRNMKKRFGNIFFFGTHCVEQIFCVGFVFFIEEKWNTLAAYSN